MRLNTQFMFVPLLKFTTKTVFTLKTIVLSVNVIIIGTIGFIYSFYLFGINQ